MKRMFIGLFICFTCLLCSYVFADTGDIFELPGTGSACGPGVGPTIQVDLDKNGVLDTLVVVFSLTGETYIINFNNNRRLYMTPVHCSSDGNARVKIRFVDMFAPGFDPENENTWVYKAIPALRIAGSTDGMPVANPATMYIYAYRNINQTNRIEPLFDSLTVPGTKVFSHPEGIKEIYILTGYAENNIDPLILLASHPNSLVGSNVTVLLDNGFVILEQVTIPGNTFIEETDTGKPIPTDFAICSPNPAPPYFKVETNAITFGNIEACVIYPDSCNDVGAKMLAYTTICGLQGCTSYWMDITKSKNTSINEICGNVHKDSFLVAQPIADNDGDGVTNINDCDDQDPNIYPGATEVCDGIDNNCNAEIDEGLPEIDVDGDDHFTPESCRIPADDCNDNDKTVYPGAIEICDNKDNNCNDQIDEGLFTDADGDGHYALDSCIGPADDCNDNDPNIGACNTPPGADSVTFDDPDGNATVTIEGITAGGDTTINSQSCDPSEPTQGFILAGNATCVNVESTAEFTKAKICINYDPDSLSTPFHVIQHCPLNGSDCEYLIPTSDNVNPDTGIGTACVEVDQLSQFAVGSATDEDKDFVPDLYDNCPSEFNIGQADDDGDNVGNICDNCKNVKNAGQSDLDGDDIGDACDCNGSDFDQDGDVDGTDLSIFSADFGRTDCNNGSICEGDIDQDGDVDGSDLSVFSAVFGKTDCAIIL